MRAALPRVREHVAAEARRVAVRGRVQVHEQELQLRLRRAVAARVAFVKSKI